MAGVSRRGRHSDQASAPDAHFRTSRLDVFFNSDRAGVDGQLLARLSQFIGATKGALDCAIYDLRAPEILKALRKQLVAGVRLRIAYDAGPTRTGGLMADPKPSGTEDAIKGAGLASVVTPVHLTGRHLMHVKSLVRDGRSVWTGSANFTTGGLQLQDNNCLVVASAALARAYTSIFDDLITAPLTPASTSVQVQLTVGGLPITPYFAPDAGEGVDQLTVRLVGKARKLRLLFFVMSDPDILAAVGRFKAKSADVKGVYDPNGMQDVLRFSKHPKSSFWFLSDRRFRAAPSHPFSTTRENDFMHNKTMILDDRYVITGSYNFSENAEANDENLLLIDSRPVAAAYSNYFDTLHRAYGGS